MCACKTIYARDGHSRYAALSDAALLGISRSGGAFNANAGAEAKVRRFCPPGADVRLFRSRTFAEDPRRVC